MKNETSPDILKTYLPVLLAQYPIELAYLYGSTAANQTTPFSDIDIALVVTPDSIGPTQQLRFELMIEDALAEHCQIGNADVRIINHAPLALRGQVVTQGILLYARDNRFRINFETSTRSEFFDFQPLLTASRNAFFHSVLTTGLHGQRTKNRRNAAQPE